MKDNRIILENKETLVCGDFKFKCAIGKNGIIKNKKEGDKKTPEGIFKIGSLFYRQDRKKKPQTKLNCVIIKKTMGWCDDPNSKKNYNKLINVNKNTNFNYEKLYRNSSEYNYFIPIKYNTKKRRVGKGSAIFIHLTNNYKKTAGCISLKEKDFLILLKLINKNTKLKIN